MKCPDWKVHRNKSGLTVASGWEEMGCDSNVYEVSFGGVENILKLDCEHTKM